MIPIAKIIRPVASVLFLALLGGCDYGRMYDQEYIHTQEASLPAMPGRTVPFSGGIESLKNADPKDLMNPLPFDRQSVERGREAYSYYCEMCHGPRADGNGTVGQSFAPLPADLQGPTVQNQIDGALFKKISLGFRRHPPLAGTVSTDDRWALVHFMRTLRKQ